MDSKHWVGGKWAEDVFAVEARTFSWEPNEEYPSWKYMGDVPRNRGTPEVGV